MRRKERIAETWETEENITTVSTELSRSLLGRSTKIFFSLVLPQASQQKFHQKTYRSVFFPVLHLSHIFHPEALRSKSNKLEQWQSLRNIYGMRWKKILVRSWYRSIKLFCHHFNKLSPTHAWMLFIHSKICNNYVILNSHFKERKEIARKYGRLFRSYKNRLFVNYPEPI